ncbi:hypothetical protein SARC_08381 [Sphaeroforma arctica JP610]|uniref:Palmitoyltransferase n=1 Tax=Sphaeroforma arctica JP610 TaxID=667725 RepID=A0A0L0FQX9_9EUKA|nr:hypothetical protein SARC_08381 [Sphaeroforma arctica JP610]KNC79212.1 hypothetical protein SARC_08381 [Sphaeroforma arctica JP610]|eukprot:XP_014153114.1 hypothetical protein SARC_08381 [Sphaeroforma arctica JP610]
MDALTATGTSPSVVDTAAAEIRATLDADNLSVVVYFTIGFTGLLQLPLIVDAIDSLLPNTIGRATHAAVSWLLIVGIISVYLGCLVLNIAKVLPFWQDEYGMSNNTFLIHTAVTMLLVTNSLSQYALAAILIPTKVTRPHSQKTTVKHQKGPSDHPELPRELGKESVLNDTKKSTASDMVQNPAKTSVEHTAHTTVSESECKGDQLGVVQSSDGGADTSDADRTRDFGEKNTQEIGQAALMPETKPGVYCKTCGAERTRWQNHCHTCGCCSALMDHHCPFLNGCVWERNYVHFFLFLGHSVNAVLYSWYVTYPIFYTCFLVGTSEKSVPCQGIGPALSFIAVPLTMLGGLVLALFFFEVFLLYIRMSTYEFLKKLNTDGPCFAISAMRTGRASDYSGQSLNRFQILVRNPVSSAGIWTCLLPIHSIRLLWTMLSDSVHGRLIHSKLEKGS